MKRYECAICKRLVRYDGPLPEIYPFCSERCKWVDLGHWLNGDYSIDRDLTPEDEFELPPVNTNEFPDAT
ncbi:MAG: DNA gyrase inhibitor YacG [Phycisphaerae bacterium]|nr:DNA gyrase inhibitor YacG [Phycisphaerae bacterium]